MKLRKPSGRFIAIGVAFGILCAVALIQPEGSRAQQRGKAADAALPQDAADGGTDAALEQQLDELRRKIAELEATLQRKAPSSGRSSSRKPAGARPMGRRMGAGMSKDGMDGEMGSMPEAGGQGMGGMKGMDRNEMMKMMQMMEGMKGGMPGMTGTEMMGGKGMQMMGNMPGMGGMSMPSALPGFPGASHIYHIGSTGFFLDHPDHITLTQEQQTQLNQMKEKSLLQQADFDRRIANGEQELWVLTGSDQPDAKEIEKKVQEIGKLRAEQRMAFIRAVGEAAQVLTVEQRQTLVGARPDQGAAGQAAPHKAHTSNSKP